MSTPEVIAKVFARTDRGKTRDHNEDTFLIADLTRGISATLYESAQHEVGPRGCLFLVADGMGGAAAGEIASSMAAEAIYRFLQSEWGDSHETSPDRFAATLRQAVEKANIELHEYAKANPDVRGMGTTATVGGILDGALYLAQVGDSRAYLIRGGEAVQLTKDQSLTQRLVDAGEMTEEEAEKSTRRNIILQALGPDPTIRAELSFMPLLRGDVILICSDGLSGQVKREEIAELATSEPDPQQLCEALIDLANTRGGPDNITSVVIKLDGPGLPELDEAIAIEYQATPLLYDDEPPVATTPIHSTQPIKIDPETLQAAHRGVAPKPQSPVPPVTRAWGRSVVVGTLALGGLALLYYFVLVPLFERLLQ